VSAIARAKSPDTVLEQRIKRNPTLTWPFDVSPTTGTRLPTSPLRKITGKIGIFWAQCFRTCDGHSSSQENVTSSCRVIQRFDRLDLDGRVRSPMHAGQPRCGTAGSASQGEDRFPRLWESGTRAELRLEGYPTPSDIDRLITLAASGELSYVEAYRQSA
jgi:hypothetical protein